MNNDRNNTILMTDTVSDTQDVQTDLYGRHQTVKKYIPVLDWGKMVSENLHYFKLELEFAFIDFLRLHNNQATQLQISEFFENNECLISFLNKHIIPSFIHSTPQLVKNVVDRQGRRSYRLLQEVY